VPDLQSQTRLPHGPAPEVIRSTPGQPVDSFIREQHANRHGKWVRWFASDVGVLIEVTASAAGVSVSGSARGVNREFARDLAAVLEVAAWAQRQLALGVDVMALWPEAKQAPCQEPNGS
jgi:hypothetical protein